MIVRDKANIGGETARILIVDDHPALCEGLGHRISVQPDMDYCGHAADVDEALRKIRELSPDLVVVDINLKSSDGLELIRAINGRSLRVRTVVHSMYEESRYAERSLQAGAMGYVNKEANPAEVIQAIREVLAGRVYLSPEMTHKVLSRTRAVSGAGAAEDPVDTLTERQLHIFRLIGEGLGAQDIATRLHISVHTVETHRENIKRKLNVATASDLSRHATLWAAQSE